MGVFDSKYFNSEVFGKYTETIPRVKQNALLKAGVLRTRPDIAQMFPDQTGGNFGSIPMVGRIGGTALNYDGSTNITATGLATYLQSMIVVGRAKAWNEKDFSYDITGHDFMEDIASQVVEYWEDVDQATILATLAGIFGVTDDSFATKHTLNLTGATSTKVGATALNDAVAQASGDNKGIFRVAIMHSVVATNLENLQVLDYWKYTDENGVQRDTNIASWNGRTVFVDDSVPVDTTGSDPVYTTYLLGEGAFDYVDCGAKVPVETARDPYTSGGVDALITRQRKIFAPRGFSFVQPQTPVVSPTDTNLATAACWGVVKDTAGTGYYPSKALPFARILSEG